MSDERPTALVFPPLWETIDTPPLGPAVLAKALADVQQPADVYDLNLSFHRWLYEDTNLDRLADEARRCDDAQEARAWLSRLRAMPFEARFGAQERHAALLFACKAVGMGPTPLLGAARFLTAVDSSKLTMAELISGAGVRPSLLTFWRRWLAPHVETIAASRAKVVGITIGYVAQLLPAILLAQELRAYMTSPPALLAGGPYCTFMTVSGVDLAPLFEVFDGLGVGPGEDVIVAASRALGSVPEDNSHDADEVALPTEIPGLWVRDQPRTGLGRPAPLGPDFSSFPLEEYFSAGEPMFPLEASRGCWARCRYCNAMSLSRGYRVKPLEQVVEEVAEVQTRYPGAAITFVDAVIAPKRAVALAEALAALASERGHRIPWRCCIRPDARLDAEQCKTLAAGGAYWIFIGFDAATDDLLEEIDKRTTLEEMRELVENLKAAGIVVAGNFILGLPGADAPDQEAILEFVDDLSLDREEVTTSIFGLVRGSWYYEHIDEMGWPDEWVARVKANDVLTDFLPTPPVDWSRRTAPKGRNMFTQPRKRRTAALPPTSGD